VESLSGKFFSVLWQTLLYLPQLLIGCVGKKNFVLGDGSRFAFSSQDRILFLAEGRGSEVLRCGSCSLPQAWADDVQRFQRMFRHDSHVQLKVVIGNHDVGFHYQ
jgi:hypothetical protein